MKNLLAVGLDADAGSGTAVDLEAFDPFEIGDLDPLHPFGGQHARRRELGHHPREPHLRRRRLAGGEVGGDLLDGGGLASVVELGQHHLPDLAVDGVEPVVGHEPAQHGEDPLQRPQIDADDLLDVGVLDLDRHLLARRQPRAVHLADRRRGDRHGRELREHLGRRAPAKLLAQPRLDVAGGAGRNLILQPLQLLPERVGQDVGHDADELPHLDEEPAQLDDGGLDPAGVPAVLLQRQALDRGRTAKPARDRQAEIRDRDLGGHEVGGEETCAARHARIIPSRAVGTGMGALRVPGPPSHAVPPLSR